LAVFGQVGRCRARRGGGPERSGGRAAQPRAIRPGAPINQELIRDVFSSLCHSNALVPFKYRIEARMFD
jgi:hypothetical protein